MAQTNRYLTIWIGCTLVLANLTLAAEHAEINFSRDIRSIFAQKCLECHGPDLAEGGLRLDLHEAALSVLDSGNRAIVPGEDVASQLIRRVTTTDEDERMPPDGDPLSQQEVTLLRRWIQQGATWEVHWAYRPLEVKIPTNIRDSWARNAIDHFVLSRLRANNTEPSALADRYTLIKRLHYDLLGLPPQPDEVNAFAGNRSPDVYERLVDRLLASQHFGERWGRHWLDKARYADSDGYEKDNVRNDAWRYRDWVIQAINQDLPFDQFTVKQLAGDLLPSASADDRLATAFNRQTLTNTEGGTDQEQWRVAAVMDRTETLGTVWLGLTVGCARCHSHKYDLITLPEYYQLYAYFNNGDETNTNILHSDAALLDYQDALQRHERAIQQLEQGIATTESACQESTETLRKELAELKKKTPQHPTMSVRVISQRIENPRKTHILRRGEFREPLNEVRTGTLSTLPAVQPRSDSESTDRLDLAHWLVDGRNPLPPRVIVNQIWSKLFGEGLVRTMNDFGVRGDRPTHPALLDYLAAELIARGWSRKSIIRYVVSSAAYRQSSRYRPELFDVDPTNRLIYRQNRYRVEAEVIRDVALSIGGLLVHGLGGPSVFPPIPDSITDLTYNSSFKWKTSANGDQYRRGMYTFFKRTAPHPNLITFDCPDSNVTSVKRGRSNTPIGALVTLNNPVFVEAARGFARRVLAADLSDDASRLERASRLCLARHPTKAEISRLLELLSTNRLWYSQHLEQADRMVDKFESDSLANSELAAWVATLRVMLNLDEVITRE